MRKKKKKYNLKGYSHFEILVTISIIMLLSLVVFPVSINKIQISKLESSVSQLSTDIQYQQNLCFFKNISGGIHIDSNRYSLFFGDTYATSTDIDIKDLPKNINITDVNLTSNNEIFFTEGNFKPSSYGTLNVTDGINTFQIYINKEGLVGYEKK